MDAMVRTFNARGVCNDLYDDATKIKGSPRPADSASVVARALCSANRATIWIFLVLLNIDCEMANCIFVRPKFYILNHDVLDI